MSMVEQRAQKCELKSITADSMGLCFTRESLNCKITSYNKSACFSITSVPYY